MPKILFGEYRPDIASSEGDGTSFVKNVVPDANGYAPFRDLEPFTTAFATPPYSASLDFSDSRNSQYAPVLHIP